MGQRHQLFAIAKVGNRYRSLAALHHQWLYGQSAVSACRRLVEILQHPRNRPLLEYEKRLAATLPDEKWEQEFTWQEADRPVFPFLSTCLLLGASINDRGNVSNVMHLPFNTPYDGGDNNDGVTILDITDPARVRYAFVFPPSGSVEPAGNSHFSSAPLTAREYLEFYNFDDGGSNVDEDEWENRVESALRNQDGFEASIDGVPMTLIDEETLASAWPPSESTYHKTWQQRTALDLPAIPSESNTPAPEETQTDMQPGLEGLHNAFVKTYETFREDYDEEEAAKEDTPATIKQLVHIVTSTNGQGADEPPLKSRAETWEPTYRVLTSNDLSIWTFPLDDAPSLTAGSALDALDNWLRKQPTSPDSLLSYHDFFQQGCSEKPQSLVICFGLADAKSSKVVRPLPGKAWHKAKAAYHSSADWVLPAMAPIRAGEWTVFVLQDWDISGLRSGPPPQRAVRLAGVRCAFVSRDEGGEFILRDARQFREMLSCGAEYEAALALDPDEERYGDDLIRWVEGSECPPDGAPLSAVREEDLPEILEAMRIIGDKQKAILRGDDGSMWAYARTSNQRRARARAAAASRDSSVD